MADMIGRIAVPLPVNSGLVWPITTEYGYGESREWEIITHRFGSGATLQSQRFSTGSGIRKFQFIKKALTIPERKQLQDFFNAVQGSYQYFTYNAPDPNRVTFTTYNVIFDNAPVTFTDLATMCSVGIQFIEFVDPSSAPSYPINNTLTRYPDAGLAADLLSDIQTVIPLIRIRVRNTAVPDIFFSDRRVTVGGVAYLPRLLNIGESGTDVVFSQDISGKADTFQFSLGNADRAISALLKDTSIRYADISFSLYHVNTGIKLDLWRGNIQDWQTDGSEQARIMCSDGLFQITQPYPRRTITHDCWKTFDDKLKCPFTSQHGPLFPGADPTSCDFSFNGPNGCLAHGMSPYFGGHPTFPQSVVIKDDGTGVIFGFGRSTVTSTSVGSDSMWGQALPEIWCNDDGNPQNAFIANAIIAAVRDESTFEDVLGIIGVGPLGLYEGMSVQTNADGYTFIVAPLADGFLPQGFNVNGQLQITGYHPNMGVREILGADPAQVSFGSLTISGTTCTWTSGNLFTIIGPGTDGQGYGAQIFLGAGIGWVIVGVITSPTTMTLVPKPGSGFSLLDLILAWQTLGISELVSKFTSSSNGYGNHTNIPWGVAPDAFALGQGNPQIWDVPDPVFSNVLTSAPNQILPFAAGTAFVELRYPKSPGTGLAPTTAESHNMTVPIAQGLTGISDVSGTLTPGLTNPFWVGLNCFLRALGLDSASPSIQQQYYIPKSLFAGDGSGCAEIADLMVPPVFGDPTVLEKQFRFMGTLTEFKPFRDWLVEILSCANGFFTFDFGKLRLGIRENASASVAYTVGNMLYQSLVLKPVGATFEYLKIDFANKAIQYQLDMAEYNDKDFSRYMNRAGAPLTSRMRSVGLSTLSQAARVAVTRTREEIGGVLRPDQSNPYIEYDNANLALWKTTILGLDTAVGAVASITHPDLTTYPGLPPTGALFGGAPPEATNTWKFRVERFTLHKDWSVTLNGRSVTDSMYVLDYGPKPINVQPAPLPVLFYPQPVGPAWAPLQVQATADDYVWPYEWTYSLSQIYTTLADSSVLAQLVVAGALPINTLIPNCGAPLASVGKVTQSTTGGYLPGNKTYRIAFCANLSDRTYSPPSEVLIVQVPVGTNTNTITVSGIRWPLISGLVGFAIFFSDQDQLICAQQFGLLTDPGNQIYTPMSITITGNAIGPAFQRSTWGLPDPNLVKVRVKERYLTHGGPVGAKVTTVSGHVVNSVETIDSLATDNWANRAFILLGRASGEAPYYSAKINSFNATTGDLTLATDAAAHGVLIDDAFVIGFLGYDNSASPRTLTDAGLSNATNPIPHTGETPSDPNRIGNVVIAIAGTNRGAFAKIVDNTSTSYTLDRDFIIDATTLWIVATGAWSDSGTDATDTGNAALQTVTQIPVDTSNFLGQARLVGGFTVDQNGVETTDAFAVYRMIYVFGLVTTIGLPSIQAEKS